MKKLLFLLICLILCVAGCSAPQQRSDKIKVVSTLFCGYDFARAVGGEKIENKQLLPPGTDIHTFEPTPTDITDIVNCDIFVYIGGESETWVERILSSVNTDDMRIIRVLDYVQPTPHEHAHEHTEHCDEHHGEYDEHVWTSPLNAIEMVGIICDALCAEDPGNANTYRISCEDYIKQIKETADKISEVVNSAEKKRIVVADRFPFKYFAEYYGLSYSAAFAGCEADTDADLMTVIKLIEDVNNNGLNAVFCTEFSSRNVADTVAENTGAEVLELHSAHNVSAADFYGGTTYVEIMNRNLEAINRGLR